MFKRFYPKLYIDTIYDIDYLELKKNGIKNIIFDIDNTLVPHDVFYPDEPLINHFKDLQFKGFQICLVSNNKEKRVIDFNKDLNFHAVHKAGKPKKTGLQKAIEHLNSDPESICIIGDQIFTDIWGGNRLNLYTILVKPICNRDEFTVKLKRRAESIVVNRYIKNL